jgi:hypothetical protein
MAPTRPATGGRPRNAWTSSRHRKLVRLHTLTTLSKEEIGIVLSSNDFNPWYVHCGCLYSVLFFFLLLLPNSVRDIGKKIGALFPKDYGQNHHKYHPSKSNLSTKALMIQRFERLRRHRTRKLLTSGQDPRSCGRIETPQHASPHSQEPSISLEGPSSAFRNYGIFCHSLAFEDSSETQLVNPSSLLLDGSLVPANNTASSKSRELTAPAPADLEHYDMSYSDFPAVNSELAAWKSPSLRSSIPSLHALEERLSRCSSSIIRHVHSVLRYSSTSSWTSAHSWRSSWLSFDSSMETLASIRPTTLTDEGTEPSTPLDTSISKSVLSKLFFRRTTHPPLRVLKKAPDSLPLAEQRVWRELIDDNQLPLWVGRPTFYPMSLNTRSCYQHHCHKAAVSLYGFTEQEICKYCGFLPVHSFVTMPQKLDVLECWSHQFNKGDYFNNRPLHFAAAALIPSGEIIRIIAEGGDPKSISTSGKTFVHILFQHVQLRNLLHCYQPLLKYLAALNFDFSCRDYHGQTPWHMLLRDKSIRDENDLEKLGEAIEMLKPDLDLVDNFGLSIRFYILKKTNKDITRTQINKLLPAIGTPQQNFVEFRHLLNEASDNWQTYVEEILDRNQVCWIDINGDTALTALVKGWKQDFDELLLEDAIRDMVAKGAEVNMRDRVGNTALAIATRRGLRSAVTTLVDLGASIHSRDYQKIGILKQAQNSLAQAKDIEADKLYSMILSCIVFLADLGATIDTHAYREWGASWVPLQDLDIACSLYPKIRLLPGSDRKEVFKAARMRQFSQ